MKTKITYCLFAMLAFLFVGLQAGLAQESPEAVSFSNQSVLLNNMPGGGTNNCTVDMNGDFLDDVVRVTGAGLYIDFQQEDGSFTQTFFPEDFQNSPGWSICAGDIDGNGYNDLLFGGGSRVSFVMANDDGTAYTEDFHDLYIFSQRSTMADIDNDGHLDAFVCHDVDQSHPYRNDGEGNLVLDQTLIETIDLPGNYAAIWVDYDNDNDIDLYITKCRQGSSAGDIERTNALYQNNGDGTYTEVGEAAGVDDNAQSWATVFEDFDNDGDFDAFVVNHDFQNRFYLNNGDGTFTDIIETTGINPNDLGAWENASGDFNNDGYVDIFSELNHTLYLNNGDLTFTGQSAPVDEAGIGDLNNDGFLDLVAGNSLFLNDANDNNWVKICTEGIISNKNGIGARIEIHGEWGVQIREVRSGQTFSPMSSLNCHFGIGDATAIDQIIVRWPSGMITTVDNPEINNTHILIEASCLLPPVEIEIAGELSICPDQSVTLSAPDGYDSALWSNGETTTSITVSESGTYRVVAYDEDGCAAISNNVAVSVIQETMPSIITNDDLVFCQNDQITLTAETYGASNPIWSNGVSAESIVVNEAGEYSVATTAICSDESLNSESVMVEVLPANPPVIESVDVDPDGVALLVASGENLDWYDMAVGGTLLGSGPNLMTGVLTEDATYYVESTTVYGGGLQEGGKLNIDGGGGLPGTGAYSRFDAYEPFTINTVEVMVPDNAPEGVRTIQLWDNSGNMLEEQTFDLVYGLQVIELNFEVPIGEDFSLRCPENNLFRNNDGVDYPYAIGDVGTITTSFYGMQYYYYFYNWKIEKPSVSCPSVRIPVEVMVVGIDDLTDVSGINVYPNPTTGLLNVNFEATSSEALQIVVFDALGKQVFLRTINQLDLGENQHTVDFTTYPAGVYQLHLKMENKLAVRKIVVE